MKQFLIAAFVSMLLLVPGVAAAEDKSVRLFLGADCAHCEDFVLVALARNDGVKLAEIDQFNQWILVLYDDALVTPTVMVNTLNMFGFDPEIWPGDGASGGGA